MWDEQATVYLRRIANHTGKMLKLMETGMGSYDSILRADQKYVFVGDVDGAPIFGGVRLSVLPLVSGGAAP